MATTPEIEHGPDGAAEVMAPGPPRMGWSIDRLPDGRLLTSGDAITRHEPDGTTTVLRERGANETAVDPRGDVYLDGFDGDFAGGAFPDPG